MDQRAHPDYSSWIVNRADPRDSRMFDTPRRAVVRTTTYGGHRVTLQLYAVARAPGYICVRQEISGRAPWSAWVQESEVTPV